MNILGLGIDIVNINRIRSSIKKNKRFKEKIFSKTEILDCNKKKGKRFLLCQEICC